MTLSSNTCVELCVDKNIMFIVKYICIKKNTFDGGLQERSMECLNCGNCKSTNVTYFCLLKNDFVLNENIQSVTVEKNRSGWKKGDPNYEIHRRKTRKEVEV
ncbi:MAG: hypothetical protein N2489_03680 [Clostridia bacterium]|nr:hypothetical protein [Clostridia bacterium]